MSSRRTAKVAEAIRQVVSTAILFGLRDPRVQHVTILRVETPVDLRTSKIYVGARK
jgi:ribosome-binding factor A